MAISRQIQNLLSKRKFDAIEDEWLAQSESDIENLDYFVGVARALAGTGEASRAQFLLELLDDQIRQQERWTLHLIFLRQAGEMLEEDAKDLHPKILDSLEQLYGSQNSFEGLVEQLGLRKGVHDLKKTWEKADRLEVLINFDVGASVLMEGKGAGKVVDVNFALESLKIDFDRIQGMMVGFRAAAKLLQPLPDDHILARKRTEKDALKKLAKGDPPDLLRIVLESYDRPLSAAEVKEDLKGIVSPQGWNSWWTAARKHPQLISNTKGRPTYRWAASTEDAAEVVWRKFTAADPRGKIDLLRRDGARDEELAARMAVDLNNLGTHHAGGEPPARGLAFEIWCALERAGFTPDNNNWSPEALLAAPNDPRRLCNAIQDRSMRERAYGLLRQNREDWQEIFLDLLTTEDDARLLTWLAEQLEQDGSENTVSALGSCFDRLMSQPRKHPAGFVWMVERAAEDEALRQRNPLTFLRQILTSIDDETFAPFRAARLKPHLESGGAVPRLLTHLGPEHAAGADQVLQRSPALEDYQRKAMRTALELRFSSLRKDSAEDQPLYALKRSIDAKRDEFQHLKSVELPANRKAIEEARAMGDLRENFEYKSARQRHEYLSARVAGLNHDLSRAQPIDSSQLDLTEVRIGTVLRLAPEGGGEERSLTLLGPWESDPDGGVISYESELGQKILGARVGAEVKIGDDRYTLQALERYTE
jgi:transcription elongation GreA/GreB family factor